MRDEGGEKGRAGRVAVGVGARSGDDGTGSFSVPSLPGAAIVRGRVVGESVPRNETEDPRNEKRKLIARRRRRRRKRGGGAGRRASPPRDSDLYLGEVGAHDLVGVDEEHAAGRARVEERVEEEQFVCPDQPLLVTADPELRSRRRVAQVLGPRRRLAQPRPSSLICDTAVSPEVRNLRCKSVQSFASDHRYAQTNHVYGPLRKIHAHGPMYSDFCACRWSLANDCTDLWL